MVSGIQGPGPARRGARPKGLARTARGGLTRVRPLGAASGPLALSVVVVVFAVVFAAVFVVVFAAVFAAGRAPVAARRAPATAPGRSVVAGAVPGLAAFGATKRVFGTAAVWADWVVESPVAATVSGLIQGLTVIAGRRAPVPGIAVRSKVGPADPAAVLSATCAVVAPPRADIVLGQRAINTRNHRDMLERVDDVDEVAEAEPVVIPKLDILAGRAGGSGDIRVVVLAEPRHRPGGGGLGRLGRGGRPPGQRGAIDRSGNIGVVNFAQPGYRLRTRGGPARAAATGRRRFDGTRGARDRGRVGDTG